MDVDRCMCDSQWRNVWCVERGFSETRALYRRADGRYLMRKLEEGRLLLPLEFIEGGTYKDPWTGFLWQERLEPIPGWVWDSHEQ